MPGLALGERRPARPRLGPRERQRRRLDEPADRRRARRRARCSSRRSSPGSSERREPMLPMRFFRDRAFSAANGASLFMYFGMFGSIFLLTQFFQTAQGYSPLESGLRVLPWTAMPLFVAPIAGALSDRIGGGRIMATGLFLQAIGLAWIAAVTRADRRLRVARRAVHRLRDRHGAVLRAGRVCRPLRGSAAGGREGERRQQRHPRGRRSVRRGRSRVALRPLRRLRVPGDLQRRPRACALGRRGRRRRGGLARAPHPAAAERPPSERPDPSSFPNPRPRRTSDNEEATR